MLALSVLGIEADEDEVRDVLAAVKERGLETKALLPFEDVARLIRERIGARAAV
jgi:hypothetical protein